MKILKRIERITNPASNRKLPWLIELSINVLIVIASLGLFADLGNNALTNTTRWIAIALMSLNFLSEAMTAKETYKRKERPWVSFVFNQLVWVEITAIVFLAMPEFAFWALAIVRLFRLIYLFGKSTLVKVSHWVVAQYGQSLLDLLIVTTGIVLMFSAIVLTMQSVSGYTAFGDVDNFLDAFYYTIIAITSVGFGDILPLTDGAQALTIVLASVGVILVAIIGGIIVAGFSRGYEVYRSIEADSIKDKSKILAMKIELESYKTQNKYANRINKILALLRIKKRVRMIMLSTHVIKIEQYINSHKESTKEMSLEDMPGTEKEVTLESLDEKLSNLMMGTTNTADKAILGHASKNFKIPTYRGSDDSHQEFELYKNATKGKWTLLMFYPKDFTFVCPTELRATSKAYEEFAKRNVEVVSVSTQSVKSHRAWTQDTLGVMNYDMGYDKDGLLGDYFGILDHSSGLNRRGTILIDPDGKVWAIYALEGEAGRSVEETLRIVDATQVAFNGGFVPCEWRPGGNLLDVDKDAKVKEVE